MCLFARLLFAVRRVARLRGLGDGGGDGVSGGIAGARFFRGRRLYRPMTQRTGVCGQRRVAGWGMIAGRN